MFAGLLPIGLPCASAFGFANEFVLVDKGKAAACIVLPSNAHAQDRRAAEILESSVVKMTGITLSIGTKPVASAPCVVLFGRRPSKPLPQDGFTVQVTPSALSIFGGPHKGSIYAVVDLLEKEFGCRYFSPKAQLFPKLSSLRIGPGTWSDHPVNTIRAINGDFDTDPEWVDWQRLTPTDEIFGKGYYVHTFHRLVPPDTYFGSHPEYFALVNGKRQRDQLCPSNPENVRIAVETLKREMGAQPDKQVWSVSQNDNETYCHCPECMKAIAEDGTPSGPILRFVNAVARHFPHKTISTLAYLYSRHAPKVTRPDPNVQIMLCTIELNRSRPIESDPGSADFRKDIVDWGHIANNIYLWDYTVNFSHQVSPFPNLAVLQPNIQFFVRNNARQQFQQTNTSPGHEFSELKSYLEARLLWNPDANVDAIKADFLRGYYKEAAPYISQYIDELESNLAKAGTLLDIYEPPTSHRNDFLSVDAVESYDRLFEKALAAVDAKPEVLQRVKVARLPLEYAKVVIGSDDMFGTRGFFVFRQGKPVPRPPLAAVLADFQSVCAVNHVRSVNEANLRPSEFCDVMKQMLDLQVDGNFAFQSSVTANPAPSPKYGRGDLGLLTNGIRGGNDFHIQWLGWEGVDCDLVVDLGGMMDARVASVDSLYVPNSWVLHPESIACFVSSDGTNYIDVGKIVVGSDQRTEHVVRRYDFKWNLPRVRYVKLHVTGTHVLPPWHSAAGGKSWFFLDEISVH